jgi:hypothetical protein
VAGLDARAGSAVGDHTLDVTTPLATANTAVAGSALQFAANGPAWAVYRLAGTGLTPLSATLTGSGPLWLLAADYATGHWHVAGLLSAGTLQLDYTALTTPRSPGGFLYLAVVASPAQTGQLAALSISASDTGSWNLTATAVPGGIQLQWDGQGANSYRVLRSNVEGDASSYVVGAVGGIVQPFSFVDPITNYTDATWEPASNDNGTPADATDDFPSVAPGLKYYYQIVPIVGGNPGQSSGEVSVTAPWGTRRSARRPLPDTTSTTRVFADQLNVAGMTAAQNQFCATHFVGTQKIVKRRADELRAFNPDFIVLGYHLGTGAGNIGNAAGNAWDDDADWPYVDRHEGWFHHLPGSPEPNQRVDQLDYHWKVMDPDSQWADYLAGSMLEMLGEDHFDGWFLDSTSEMWNTSPAQWWEGPSMFGFWTPQLDSMFLTVNARLQAHPLQPYVIPNAGAYITTASDIKYYGCDGIMIEGYAHNSPGSYFALADWQLELDRVLDHQGHGVATILQGYIDSADINDRLFLFGSYLLVRGPKTYINWLASDMDSGVGQWYPEWDVSFGAPLSGQPADVAALALPNGLYRRDFAQGVVVVNPTDSTLLFTPDVPYTILTPMGGGNLDAAGNPPGSVAWLPLPGAANIAPHQALILKK